MASEASLAAWDDGTQCARLYLDGLTCEAIGARLGMHPVTVRRRLDAQGIPREHGASRRTSWEVREQIVALTEQGWSQLAIADALSINKRTVARFQPRLRTIAGLCRDSDAPAAENEYGSVPGVEARRLGVLTRQEDGP